MPKKSFRRLAITSMLVSAASIGAALPASAAPVVIDLPAGVACPDFDLRLELGEGNAKTREFTDKDGRLIRLLQTGTSGSVIYTNLETGEQISQRSRGTAIRTTPNVDGSSTVVVTGHFVLILFETDVPAGPSTTVYQGRVVYTDTAATDTLVETSGKQTDICAELRPSP